jgi:hypothetical protein
MWTVSSLKERSTLGASVDVRCSKALIAVTAHVIGSQGVNPHEYDVGLLFHGNVRRANMPLLLSLLILFGIVVLFNDGEFARTEIVKGCLCLLPTFFLGPLSDKPKF